LPSPNVVSLTTSPHFLPLLLSHHPQLNTQLLSRIPVFKGELQCRGGVEYLHRGPARRKRRRKWKSRIWDSKLWSRVPRNLNPKMTALARTSSKCKRQTRPLVRESAPHEQTRNTLTVIKIWS
jgi:hypothetical protein